jgi:hypothetical protein
MPVFDYGSVVYGFTYSTNLETLQKKALRIICSAGFRAQSTNFSIIKSDATLQSHKI